MSASLLTPWVESLKIQDKKLNVRSLVPNSSQRRLIAEVERQMAAGKPIRIIICKARQMGMSTITEALLFLWATLFYRGASELVIAHETGPSRELFAKTRLFWDLWIPELKRKHPLASSTHQRMQFADSRSQIKISTARNERSARGETLFAVHASEVAFWDEPEALMTGLSKAVPRQPGSLVVLESTANGVGNWFHEEWKRAEAGETEFVPMFFPWFEHEEYRASYEGREDLIEELGRLDSEERFLVDRFGVDLDQLAWRRLVLENECHGSEDEFHQEYPSTSEEAFLSTGHNVYPMNRLKLCYEPHEPMRGQLIRTGDRVDFHPDRGGPLHIYKPPNTDDGWGQYFVAGDPTYGKHDRACIQVINRRTYEQVATWHGLIDPHSFAEELVKVAQHYNDATISCEVEGPGYATIGALLAMNYPKLWRHTQADRLPGEMGNKALGWSSTTKRKGWAVNFLLKLVMDTDLTVHDKITFVQMRDFTQLTHDPFSGWGPADPKGFDDAIMALAIACICSATEGGLEYYTPGVPSTPEPAWMDWGSETG